MGETFPPEGASPTPKLALRSLAMAEALSISPRLLSQLVAENRVPHLRVHTVLLFPVREVQDWLTAETARQVGP